MTAATWLWYSAMDAALVVAAYLTATTGEAVSTPASGPSAGEARQEEAHGQSAGLHQRAGGGRGGRAE